MSRPTEPPTGTVDVEALLGHMGRAVRAARKAAGYTQTGLAEASGVSRRYVAQLEAGEGNASLLVLARIAGALGVPLTALIETAAPASETAELAAAYRAAPAALRRQVRALLLGGAAATEPDRDGRIALIGLRGAGKTTLGRALAAELGLPFVELAREVEALAGMPTGEIMALYGAEGYRRLEAEALEAALARPGPMVIAAAGGIVAAPATFERLLAACRTIWLKASPEEHMERVRAQGDTRPMAGHPRAMDELKALLAARARQYARAEAALDTSGHTVATALAELMALVRRLGAIPAAAGMAAGHAGEAEDGARRQFPQGYAGPKESV